MEAESAMRLWYVLAVRLRFLLLSVLLHLALGLLLSLGKPPVADELPIPTIEVESAPIPSSQPSEKARPSVRSRLARRRTRMPGPQAGAGDASHLSLSDLGIGPPRIDSTSNSGAGGGANDSRFAYGSDGGGVLDQIGGTVVFEEIHERIEENVFYPNELVGAGIEGTVKATLVFEPDGSWGRARSRVATASPYLRVHAMRILRRAFSEKLPATYFRHGKSLKVFCVFHFELTRTEDPMDNSPDAWRHQESRRGIVGNHLYFYRFSHIIGAWKLGPIHGYGIMPSIGVDIEELADDIAKPFSRKADIDPLELYRQDPDWQGR